MLTHQDLISWCRAPGCFSTAGAFDWGDYVTSVTDSCPALTLSFRLKQAPFAGAAVGSEGLPGAGRSGRDHKNVREQT